MNKEVKKDIELPLEKVGDMIKNARLKKKVEIEKVSKFLCIRKVYLEAIENNDYKVLPEYPYGVGFVRSYAEYLGLNAPRIVDLYRSETNVIEEANQEFIPEEEPETNTPSMKYLIISIAAVLVLYFAWLVFDKLSTAEDADNTTISESSEPFALQVEDFTTVTDEEIAPENIEIIDAPEEGGQIIIEEGNYQEPTPMVETPKGVEVKFKDVTWFEVKDGSKLYVSKEFPAGSTYQVPEGSGMILSAGRPDKVEVYINGKLVEGVFTDRRRTNISLDYFKTNQE